MSVNDQADGFFEQPDAWAKCSHTECVNFEECLYPLGPNENSGKGYQLHTGEKDLWQLTHGGIPFRLVKGFRMLLRSER
jgi:hypothetical protein